MKAIVTGGTGYIGSHVVDLLLERRLWPWQKKCVGRYLEQDYLRDRNVREDDLGLRRSEAAISANASKPTHIRKVVDTAFSRFGAIDILMNAVVFGRAMPLFKSTR